jgi:hypothetical protein
VETQTAEYSFEELGIHARCGGIVQLVVAERVCMRFCTRCSARGGDCELESECKKVVTTETAVPSAKARADLEAYWRQRLARTAMRPEPLGPIPKVEITTAWPELHP